MKVNKTNIRIELSASFFLSLSFFLSVGGEGASPVGLREVHRLCAIWMDLLVSAATSSLSALNWTKAKIVPSWAR